MIEWDTDFVRRHMSVDGIGAPSATNRNRFDSWLSEHDAKVAAKTLRKAATEIRENGYVFGDYGWVHSLNSRANDIEKESDT